MVIDSGSSRKLIRVDSVLRGQGRDPKDEQRQLWEHLGKNTYSRRNRKCRALELGMSGSVWQEQGEEEQGWGVLRSLGSSPRAGRGGQ